MNTKIHTNRNESISSRFVRFVRRPLISGLVIVIPIGMTVFVLKLIYDFTAGHLSPFIQKYVDPIPDYTSPFVAIIILIMVVYIIGLVASVVVGRRMIRALESLIQYIPFVKSIYSASKQIVQSLTAKKKHESPKVPVVIEFPCPGMKCIGFSLGKVVFRDGREFYRVFVPTTPNITVGLLQLVASENVYKCEFSLDDAIRIIVSGGILGPDHMVLERVSSVPLNHDQIQKKDDDDDWDEDEEESG
jgi:uncharacterized membrane protein